MSTLSSKKIYFRLIALWVICEALLGGIIHGLKLPVSGLIVGGCAVVCISLIAYYNPKRGAILNATIIVAIFKMILSPQSPLPAYFAVFFQGLVGELIFMNRKNYKTSAIIFCAVALLESGIQRILIMMILFGNNIWIAINDFINNLTGQKTITNYSYYLATGYVLLHVLTGLIIGIFVARLPGKISLFNDPNNMIVINNIDLNSKIKNKKNRKNILLIIWIVLIVLYIHSIVFPEKSLLPSNMILNLITRSILIILTWKFLIQPLLKNALNTWLQKRKSVLRNDFNEIMNLLPESEYLIRQSWRLSKGKGFGRFGYFWKIILLNTLRNE